MSLRSEVKWGIIVHLKKPIEHSLEISLFELNEMVPTINDYFSVDLHPDRGYESFEVFVDNNRLQACQYDKDNHRLLVPSDEVKNFAPGTACNLLIRFRETNALIRLPNSYLFEVKYGMRPSPQSLQMSVCCPELAGGRRERVYKWLAMLLRTRRTPKIFSLEKDPIELSEDELRCDFHFRPNESPTFRMLFTPIRFDIVSITLGIVGIIVLELIVGFLAKVWF